MISKCSFYLGKQGYNGTTFMSKAIKFLKGIVRIFDFNQIILQSSIAQILY